MSKKGREQLRSKSDKENIFKKPSVHVRIVKPVFWCVGLYSHLSQFLSKKPCLRKFFSGRRYFG